MYIFVYGSLKKGFSNHNLLQSSEFICKTRTQEEFAMIDLNMFPGVIKGKKVSRIQGEVYELDSNTLEQIDMYEGEWYSRESVELEAGFRAQIYFLIKYPRYSEGPMVISEGNWTEKLMQESNNVR
ncbi:gamma-glutamylcyclotransferase family protein [Methanolobus halotolerans]|uniref:Gamma-glutamylcyclotransferase n=1 Tax=Methanolobus halotolerans TaxID=2052935 RepID=A0A4E0Q5N3_9EURY|nr:gamma-glutamylcyclotransferase family protein [Methanolobus halotolerans]TGC09171.1 gamma-glutamylcyclotransferase [Methanolobus halotolerans]